MFVSAYIYLWCCWCVRLYMFVWVYVRVRADMHINVILTSLWNSQTLSEEHKLKTYIFRKDSTLLPFSLFSLSTAHGFLDLVGNRVHCTSPKDRFSSFCLFSFVQLLCFCKPQTCLRITRGILIKFISFFREGLIIYHYPTNQN